jgi:CRP-like cAMP-binding protein
MYINDWEMQRENFIMFNKLISSLTEEDSAILKNYMKTGTAPRGSTIMEMGGTSRDIYFIISGNYDIYQKILVAESPIVLHLASLAGPHLLGEVNLFLNEKRQATVLASTECRFFKLSHDSLEILLQENPSIAAKIYQHAGKILTERLKSVQDNIYERMVKTSETTQIALNNMNKYIGPTKQCSLSLAEKLFPSEANLKSNWKDTVTYKQESK